MHKQVLLGYNQLLVRECFSDLDFLVDGDDSEGGDDDDADGDDGLVPTKWWGGVAFLTGPTYFFLLMADDTSYKSF